MKAIIAISAVTAATILSIAYVKFCMSVSEGYSIWQFATHWH